MTNTVLRDSATNSVSLTSSGWTTVGDAKVVLETTYRVPANAQVGTTLNSGAGMNIVGFIDGNKVANPIGTCVTVREPNAVEAVTGSLGGLGLGGLFTGSTDTASAASFSADLINGIDFGQIIGAAAGS